MELSFHGVNPEYQTIFESVSPGHVLFYFRFFKQYFTEKLQASAGFE